MRTWTRTTGRRLGAATIATTLLLGATACSSDDGSEAGTDGVDTGGAEAMDDGEAMGGEAAASGEFSATEEVCERIDTAAIGDIVGSEVAFDMAQSNENPSLTTVTCVVNSPDITVRLGASTTDDDLMDFVDGASGEPVDYGRGATATFEGAKFTVAVDGGRQLSVEMRAGGVAPDMAVFIAVMDAWMDVQGV